MSGSSGSSSLTSQVPAPAGLIVGDGIETLAEAEIALKLHDADGNADAAVNFLDSAVRAAASPGQDNVTFLLLPAGIGGPGDRG